MNKIEKYKQEKDGYDILPEVPRYAQEGWEAIGDGDKERLKWAGIFFRRQTPGHFMMRLRMSNGLSCAAQFRTIAGICDDFGKGFADITTPSCTCLTRKSAGYTTATSSRSAAGVEKSSRKSG